MTPCILHQYTEQSARAKMTRHGQRGDHSVVMRFHHDCGAWHVEYLVDLSERASE